MKATRPMPSPLSWRSTWILVLLLLSSAVSVWGMVGEPRLRDLEVRLPDRDPETAVTDLRALGETVTELSRLTGTVWQGRWDAAEGRIDRIVPQRLAVTRLSDDAGQIDGRIRNFLAAQSGLFAAPADDLRTMRVMLRGGVWWVTYQQMQGDLPVVGARLDLRLSQEGDLLLVRDRTIRGLSLPGPGLAAGEAERRAAIDLEGNGVTVAGIARAIPGIDDYGPTAEVIVPVWNAGSGRYEAHRAFRVRHDVMTPFVARFRSYVDVEDGRVLMRTNEIAYALAEGTVQGDQHPLTPTDPLTRSPFEDLRVTVAGVGSGYTDETGRFVFDLPDGSTRTATARLEGRYCNVDRQDGSSDAQIAGPLGPGAPLSLIFRDANSAAAERDAFYHTNLVRDYMLDIDPDFTDLDYEMPVAVNIPLTCNAYWDGTGMNFYEEGGGCVNTAEIADVIYHEYGHGVSQFVYAPGSPSGAMGEGFSDYLGATITDQSRIGLGFTGPGTWLRDCDNDRTWPAPECGGESHCVGEVIAGALWHMRENLIAELGDHASGVALADHLFHFARFGGNNDFEGYYYDLLAVDDDNGTLVDGTPHAGSIIEAFDRHNIGPGFVLEILHVPVHDTDLAHTPTPIVAVFSSAVPLREDSLCVYYSTRPIDGGDVTGPTRLEMTATGGVREYVAQIPGQPLGTRVAYYLSGATSEMGLMAVDPPGAPASQHEFAVAIDTTPPTIVHEAKTERSRHVWPVPVEATVTDNQAVARVSLEYRIDGVDRPPVSLAPREGDSFGGSFGGSVGVGDVVEYRIRAADGAATPNVAYLPPEGYISMPIVRDVAIDCEDGVQDVTHRVGTPGMIDQWHLSAARDHTTGSGHSWKCGDTAGGLYADGSDGLLEILPVTLGVGASLTFWHWIDAEDGGPGLAWDGGLVEISTDGGSSWGPLLPVGGYTHTIIENPASPFPPGYPVWSGTFGWRLAQFNLSGYAGQIVRIRFRFGSDGYVTYEGWFIDDLVLVPTTNEAAAVEGTDGLPMRTGLLGLAPNPTRLGTAIRFAIAAGDGPVTVGVHDIGGRRICNLAADLIQPGRHTRIWDGRDERGNHVAAGVYFVRIGWRSGHESAKVLLLE